MECFHAFARLNNSGMPAPASTVTVYLSGSAVLANLYNSDNTGDPKSNPFTTGADGLTEFYAQNGRYDIRFSGGGIVTPWALGDILLFDATGIITTTGVLSIVDYGAVPNDRTVDTTTAAFATAVADSVRRNHTPILFPAGEYRVDGELSLPEGIMVLGSGSQGSGQQWGVTIVHHSNGHCFNWNNTGASFAGTGGGLQNFLILKETGFAGGSAVRVVNVDDLHRSGEMIFRNILAYGNGTGLWDHGLEIDGTATNTSGARGVRSVLIEKFRCADCQVSGQYIYLNQVVHCFSTYMETDTGHGVGDAGITVAGNADNVLLSGLNVGGTFTVGAAPAGGTINMVLTGRIGTDLNVSYAAVQGVAAVVCNGVITCQSPLFRIVSNVADDFMAVRDVELANQTGDGTIVTITYTAERWDKAASLDYTTGIFTARIAGRYHFTGSLVLRGIAAGHTTCNLTLLHRDSLGSTLGVYGTLVNPAAGVDPSTNYGLGVSQEIQLNAGETIRLQVFVSGSTKTVSVGMTSATVYTWFAGRLSA
jgi:hypothetical protein